MFVYKTKYSANGWRRHPWQKVMALALVCSLIWVGGLVWVGNAVAVIPDGDPTTFVSLEQIDGLDNGAPANHNLYDDDQVPDTRAGLFVLGNGGSDDNREEAFRFRPGSGRLVAAPVASAVSDYHERRTVRAYMDFGHLKVMPAGDAVSVNLVFVLLTATPRSPVDYYGWPWFFVASPFGGCHKYAGV